MARSTWSSLIGWDRSPGGWTIDEQRQRLLPFHRAQSVQSAYPAEEVTKVALRLRFLVQESVPCELEEHQITQPHSRVITQSVIQAAREAADPEFRPCVVFCLLVVKHWFLRQALRELWDATLHELRATACEVIAKHIIEDEEDTSFLMHTVLLKRYSILVGGKPTVPVNVIEKAVDLHALRVIGSSGYQKCLSYLWRGWLVQDENDPASFVDYKDRDNESFWAHMDPDRMRAPRYQNACLLLISVLYLALYTGAINSINPGGDLDLIEILLYIFTFGFIFDELTKLYKAGYHILGFWNAFNSTLYVLLMVSLGLRFVALSYPRDAEGRQSFNILSYNFLAFTAPMFWARILLYLDSFRFFGAMLVVLKVMMKESIIFFALLVVVIVGFLQAFIGMHYTEDMKGEDTIFIVQAMANAVMQSPDFTGFERFSPPFGIILYYCFTFVVMVILLNVLIALYNSAYQDIYDNSDDEYLALFAQKTMQFVRAPDENVFIAPFNLIEIFVLVIPFEWWVPREQYERMNDVVMAVLYSPVLFFAAIIEVRSAKAVRRNRRRGEEDEGTTEEWDQMADLVDFEEDGWAKKVGESKANVRDDLAVLEIRRLQKDVKALRGLVVELGKRLGEKNGDGGTGGGDDE
ncbi:hypothetical protein GGR50DRAFT_552571 [Xylaria sp. CBS 124048]|nr:hypothetical protein GGR50DRAFT_552571 [Xylaria sp. CBS 124048]